jgi:PadR family transcriptional regulator, regulatory protein AphA
MKADWPSENVILGLLAEQPMHGYELAARVRDDEALRAIWRIERSEVYFLLGKLYKCGYIAEGREQSESGPERVVYSATERGLKALADWLHTPEPYPRNLRTALLARVYIALRRDPRIALELIDAQEQVLRDWLAQASAHSSANDVVRVVHAFRSAQVRATLEALDELRGLAKRKAEQA